MPLVLLNTNPIIRYLTQDKPNQAERARDLKIPGQQSYRRALELWVTPTARAGFCGCAVSCAGGEVEDLNGCQL